MFKKALAVLALTLPLAAFAAVDENGKTLATQDYVNSINTQLGSRIKDTQDKAYSGVASAVAMTNIPTVAGKDLSLGVAFGSYGSDNALAAGLTYKPDDIGAMKMSVAINGEEVAYGAGFSFGF